MLWLATWWLRDEFLELEDGTTLYYIHDFTGPGYILRSEQQHRLENHSALYGWAIFIYFAVPDALIGSWVVVKTGEFPGAEYIIDGLLLALLLLFLYVLKTQENRLLERLDRRDPARWDDDLKLLAKSADTTNGASPLWVPAILIVGGWTIGLALETALHALFWT